MAKRTVLSGRSVLDTNSFCVMEPSYSKIFNNNFELGGILNKSYATQAKIHINTYTKQTYKPY